MKRNHTKIGRWFWVNYWFKIDWLRGNRKYYKWISYAERNSLYMNLTHGFVKEMVEKKKKSARVTNIFRPYLNWEK